MHKFAVLVVLAISGTAAAQVPSGAARASFASTSELQWDVTINQQPACSTPCQLVIPPLGYVTLHSHEDPPVRLELGYLPGGDLSVAAEPWARGEYAAGVTFTTLGGMAVVTGITLTAVGYGTSDAGMRDAGLYTLIPGAIVTAGAIWLMRDALPKAHVQPGPGGLVAQF
jgi:hypothetical protein